MNLSGFFAQLVDQVGDFMQLVFLNLDQPQSARCKGVGDRLDSRGFSGTCVAIQEGICGRTPFDQRESVVNNHLPFPLIAAQLFEGDCVGVADRDEGARLDHKGGVFRKNAVAVGMNLLQTGQNKSL